MGIRDQAKHRKNLTNRKVAIRGLSPLTEIERHKLDISKIKSNGYMRLDGKVFLVEDISHYQEYNWKLTKEKDFQSYELDLFCLNNAQRINIEWEKDDRLEVCLTDKQIKFSNLSYDDNSTVKSADLEHIIDEEDSLFLNGKEFEYDDDWAAMYHRGSSSGSGLGSNLEEGVRVRFYEFVASDGSFLTIEEWMDGLPKDADTDFDYEVFLSHPVDPDNIEILSLGS
jgi:hypothetical protein